MSVCFFRSNMLDWPSSVTAPLARRGEGKAIKPCQLVIVERTNFTHHKKLETVALLAPSKRVWLMRSDLSDNQRRTPAPRAGCFFLLLLPCVFFFFSVWFCLCLALFV